MNHFGELVIGVTVSTDDLYAGRSSLWVCFDILPVDVEVFGVFLTHYKCSNLCLAMQVTWCVLTDDLCVDMTHYLLFFGSAHGMYVDMADYMVYVMTNSQYRWLVRVWLVTDGALACCWYFGTHAMCEHGRLFDVLWHTLSADNFWVDLQVTCWARWRPRWALRNDHSPTLACCPTEATGKTFCCNTYTSIKMLKYASKVKHLLVFYIYLHHLHWCA